MELLERIRKDNSLSSCEDCSEVTLHPESSAVDRLGARGAHFLLEPLLAAPAEVVAVDALGDLGAGGHLLETNGASGLGDFAILEQLVQFPINLGLNTSQSLMNGSDFLVDLQ